MNLLKKLLGKAWEILFETRRIWKRSLLVFHFFFLFLSFSWMDQPSQTGGFRFHPSIMTGFQEKSDSKIEKITLSSFFLSDFFLIRTILSWFYHIQSYHTWQIPTLQPFLTWWKNLGMKFSFWLWEANCSPEKDSIVFPKQSAIQIVFWRD